MLFYMHFPVQFTNIKCPIKWVKVNGLCYFVLLCWFIIVYMVALLTSVFNLCWENHAISSSWNETWSFTALIYTRGDVFALTDMHLHTNGVFILAYIYLHSQRGIHWHLHTILQCKVYWAFSQTSVRLK